MSEYIKNITNEVHKLGLKIIEETLEEMNQMLRDSLKRKQNWVVESHQEKQLLTLLGEIRFQKTLFKNRKTGKSEYLLDRILGLNPHQRITEDGIAKILEEAVETSYRRGGEHVSLMEQVSKECVKEHIHKLNIPRELGKGKEKKEVENLYIDADEDCCDIL